MKKLFLSIVFVMTIFIAKAQVWDSHKHSFNLYGEVGIPLGDASKPFVVTLGLKLDYLWKITPEFKAGVATGYLRYFGNNISTISTPVILTTITTKYDDASFLPLTITANYQLDRFLFAIDTGYALALNRGVNGGFYYKPSVGYTITKAIRLNLFYSEISDSKGTFSNIGVGAIIF